MLDAGVLRIELAPTLMEVVAAFGEGRRLQKVSEI
jgi:hypothetical protein